MIISRTPYRISFFGGGTDYATRYQKHGGCVLSTSISHYCYLTSRFLPPFFNEKSRIVWSKIEQVIDNADIQHPSVREILKYLNIENGVEIHHTGDLPARSGLGSSSSFTIGLLHNLRALQGIMSKKHQLACEAIHIERDVLKENVGMQDQIAAAYGGLNRISIATNGEFMVEPVIISGERRQELQDSCLLFFTGVSRTASDIAAEQIKAHGTGSIDVELNAMHLLVGEAMSVLTSKADISEFGKLLHESWMLKRSLAKNISPQFVDDIYDKGRLAGASGGKLLGAGGGGFILFFAKPELHDSIRLALKDLLWVPFKFDNIGSQIIFYETNSYSRESLNRRDYSHAI